MNLSFLTKIKLMLSSKKRLLVIGDSHSEIFSLQPLNAKLSEKYFSFITSVGGATISGLTNPNSKTNALEIFERSFNEIKPDVLIIQIGEVDTGFVLWYRAQKYDVPIDEMLNKCLANYENLLEKFQGREKTIVISAPLPTIKDGQNWGEVANLRKDVQATQLERTNLTLEFNSKVKDIVNNKGLIFIDLDTDSLGADGIVKKELLNPNTADHHYEHSYYAGLLSDSLDKYGV